MTSTLVLPRADARPRRRNALTERLRLTAHAAVVAPTALAGVALLPLWLTLVALTPLTVVAPLLLPATWLVRRYADAHRRAAARLLARPVGVPYRRLSRPGVISRITTVLRDPASWRDALWLLLHAVVGFVSALLTLVLLLATAYWLVLPFLVHVAPRAFETSLGFVTLHDAGDAAVLVPLAGIAFQLWWWLTIPLARGRVALDRALLGRHPRPSRPREYAA
ncbi:sensor domain-containing protein [Jatrophihabitans endophyticus]|nr:sensor domain-containing protein [Jatrophihabitans endophyticus]